MSKQYYTLVAGLRELTLDGENRGFDARALIDETREQLSEGDNALVDLLYTWYDIANLTGGGRFSELGNLTREELERREGLPPFVDRILRAYAEPDNPEWDDVERTAALEKSLMEAYYDECSRSRCRFIREWSAFDRNVRNVAAALTARRLGIPAAGQTVGGGYVAESVGRSASADFGLRGELEYMDRLVAATGEGGNMIDKERSVDRLRWEMAEELTVFDYFDVDAVLAYLVKVNILHRWATLDAERGRETLGAMLEENK